jgi:hypothetical protein
MYRPCCMATVQGAMMYRSCCMALYSARSHRTAVLNPGPPAGCRAPALQLATRRPGGARVCLSQRPGVGPAPPVVPLPSPARRRSTCRSSCSPAGLGFRVQGLGCTCRSTCRSSCSPASGARGRTRRRPCTGPGRSHRAAVLNPDQRGPTERGARQHQAEAMHGPWAAFSGPLQLAPLRRALPPLLSRVQASLLGSQP